jgi:DNA-binding SARP family transcriptional activator
VLKAGQADGKKPLERAACPGSGALLASAESMDFRILGPLEVCDEARSLPLGGAKQRALLAILLLHANEVVSAERLLDDLWGDRQPTSGAKALHVYVSQLRKVIGDDRVLTRAPGYALRVDPDELDVTRFQRLREQAETAEPSEAGAILREAISLWRGAPLADFAYESFAQSEIARLEELRTSALEQRVDVDLALGRHAELVGELEALVKEHPLRERLRGQLLLALYRSARQVEALAAYQETRRALVDELGIEPGKFLRELHQAILRQDPALDLATAAEPAVEPPRGVFVGREDELAELLAGLDDAYAGRGRLFLLVGEPGIGKSRLADELIAHARARGARILVGRCWEAGGAPAYWPWVQSLRAYVRTSDTAALRSQLGAGAADVAQIVPELRQHFPDSPDLPDLPEPTSLESEGARFRLFDATAEFLRNASESRPILLVLDDLHAADVPSLLLLQFVVRELGSTRMLVLGAYRDVDPIPGQPLTGILAELAREPVTRRLGLGGLSGQNVAEYVDLTASELASPELVAALHEETEGNPLFVGETVRLLALEGLQPESTGTRVAIPQSVRDVIARRFTHLSEECNRVLVLASVLGREFALAALAHVSAVSQDDLLEPLDEAMAARVVSDVLGGPGRLRFAHVLMRDTLYEGITTARRVRLHRQALRALEALYGDEPGPHLAELAHHAVAGNEFDKGLRYAQRAGDRAVATLAYEEAARQYETALKALDLVRRSDELTRCELLLSLGEAEIRAGNSSAAKKAFFDSADIARRLGLPRQLARAAGGYAREDMYLRAGDDDRLVPLLEEGLAMLGEEEVELRTRLLARLAGALRDEPSRDRRDTLSREAVELARRTGNPAALAYALDGRCAAIVAPDTVAECLALATELREVAERIGDTERVVHGHLHWLVGQVVVGDVSELDAGLDALSRIADELRQPAQLWEVHAGRAMLALAAGRLAEGEELVRRAFALGERSKPEIAIPAYRLQRYTLCDFREQLEEVEPAIRDLVAEYPARPAFRCALAHLRARLGPLPEAKRAFDELARDEFSTLPFDQEWLYGMSLLAETSSLLSDPDSAAVLYALLLPYAALNAADWPEGIRGSVSRYLGLLATTTKRWEDAKLHFEDALAMNARMGARPWLAHTQHDYARMLAARHGPGDRERAQEFLDAALTTYRELCMERYAARASALARGVSTTP